MSEQQVRITGRILYLTEDPDILRKQLAGESIAYDAGRKLVDNISTDELTPGWVCYYYDETLARYCLVGLRGSVIEKDSIKSGGFGVIVSGRSKGCGSSRETAPYSELKAGVQLVIAESIEKIYGQNAQNIGLLTSTDFSLIDRIERGEAIPISEFTKGLDPISAQIVEYGGLFAYNRKRDGGGDRATSAGDPAPPHERVREDHRVTRHRRRPHRGAGRGRREARRRALRAHRRALQPRVRDADGRVVVPRRLRRGREGERARERVCVPRSPHVLGPRDARGPQEDGARRPGGLAGDGAGVLLQAPGHSLVRRSHPRRSHGGQRSHLPQQGDRGAGAARPGRRRDRLAHLHGEERSAASRSESAAPTWPTRGSPATCGSRCRRPCVSCCSGELRAGVCAKDVMLHILSLDHFKSGSGIGKVLEFSGDGVENLLAGRARHPHQHGGRGRRLHRHHRGRRGRGGVPGRDARASRRRSTRRRSCAPTQTQAMRRPSRSTWARWFRWWRPRAIRATAYR